MSLDITVIDKAGSHLKQVSIGVDDHYRLMQLVGKDGGLLARLEDYYADAELQNNELGRLIKEVISFRSKCNNDKQLFLFLGGLVELAEFAKHEQHSLLAIAD